MKSQVSLFLDPQDIIDVDERASQEEIPRSAWLRRAIRRQLATERATRLAREREAARELPDFGDGPC